MTLFVEDFCFEHRFAMQALSRNFAEPLEVVCSAWDSSELTCTVAILQNQVVDQTIHADLRAISERERYLSEYIKKLERNEVLSHDKYNEL